MQFILQCGFIKQINNNNKNNNLPLPSYLREGTRLRLSTRLRHRPSGTNNESIRRDGLTWGWNERTNSSGLKRGLRLWSSAILARTYHRIPTRVDTKCAWRTETSRQTCRKCHQVGHNAKECQAARVCRQTNSRYWYPWGYPAHLRRKTARDVGRCGTGLQRGWFSRVRMG